MLRSLSIAATLTGVVAALSVACSGTLDPAPTFRPSDDGDQGTSTQRPSQKSGPTLTPQESGTTQRFFAISPVNSQVAWASAAGGTFAVTTDGGRHWRSRVIPGVSDATSLQFRDVEAVSSKIAYLLAAGAGTASRIYQTKDGGNTWKLQFQNRDPNGFYDCFDFWDPDHGITFADAVPSRRGSRFPVIESRDGQTWHDIGDRLPKPQPGEAGFAASGTCVATLGDRHAWIGTGGGTIARIFTTTDAGRHWAAHSAPLRFTQGTGASGVVSLAFRDHLHGILGGGDVGASTVAQTNVARSDDGGNSWKLATSTPFLGAVFGLSYVPDRRTATVVATGPGGAAWSPDEGDTWSLLPGISDCWAVAFADRQAGWLVCANGGIIKISFDGKGDSDHGD